MRSDKELERYPRAGANGNRSKPVSRVTRWQATHPAVPLAHKSRFRLSPLDVRRDLTRRRRRRLTRAGSATDREVPHATKRYPAPGSRLPGYVLQFQQSNDAACDPARPPGQAQCSESGCFLPRFPSRAFELRRPDRVGRSGPERTHPVRSHASRAPEQRARTARRPRSPCPAIVSSHGTRRFFYNNSVKIDSPRHRRLPKARDPAAGTSEEPSEGAIMRATLI